MRASIVVLTYNQLKEGTAPCLESIFLHTPEEEYELVVVDNGSSDGTAEYLRSIAEKHKNVRLVLNRQNKGYAGGNNDGMRVASGDCIVLLNNDTLVTPGWLDSLLMPLEGDRSIGLICPVTNSAGNEQMVLLPSLNEENYVEVAGQYTRRNTGHLFDTEKLGFYCVAMRREVMEKVGLLDEGFGLGMFEDDDYCLRVRKAGYRLAVNEGCFIYHKGSLSFKRLDNEEYQEIFQRNREYYRRKHGQPWLFNDLTLAYYRHMEREITSLMSREHPPQEAERIAVRLKGFEYLVQRAREIEMNGREEGNRGGNDRSLRRMLRIFRDEYLRGDARSRLLFRRKVLRHLRPLSNQEVIDRMGAIRRKEGVRRLLIITDAPDYHLGGKGTKLADALASQGIPVLYLTMNRERDIVEVTEEVKEHLHLMNGELVGFVPHLAAREEVVQLISSVSSIDSLGQRPSSFLVDLTGGREGEIEAFSSALNGASTLFLVDEGARVGNDVFFIEVTEQDLAAVAPAIASWIVDPLNKG